MGVWVGGHTLANFLYGSKDAQENSISFDTNLLDAVGRRKKLYTKKRPKYDFTGVETNEQIT